MSSFTPLRKYSNAYSIFMLNVDHLRTLYKFYPWAANEMHYMLPQNPNVLKQFMPNITIEEGLYRIDNSARVVLRFCVIHLVSVFEDYLNNIVRELLDRTIPTDSSQYEKSENEPEELKDEYINERDRFISSEIRSFSFAKWPQKINYLEKRFGIKFNDDQKALLRNIIDTRNLLIHNPKPVGEEDFEIDQEFIEDAIDTMMYATYTIEEGVAAKL